MTVYAVHTTDTGTLVSVGTVVADPLPDGLTAVALTDTDARSLRDGAGTWDAATRTVVPAVVPPDVANLATIEGRVGTHITNLRNVKANGTAADKVIAAALLDVIRVLNNRLDAVD